MNNAMLDLIRERRSIRAYEPRQITDEELRAVLEAGTYAPTGHGLQDPYIVAVQNPEMCDRLRRFNATFSASGPDHDPFYGAPTIVLVFAPKPEQNPNGFANGTLVLGTMMLAAHAIGLGSCWINREREMFATPEGEAIMAQLGLPQGLMGVGALALGYAAAPPKPAKPRKPDYYRIIK
ncbi:MAG: nitroreductase family protein [Bacteroidales bacterium]|nr:nitroreductase family protein [Bacteroidales bacterium]